MFFMKILFKFSRTSWYRKKRFVIPACLLILLFIAGIILGAVLGVRNSQSETSMTFNIFLILSWIAVYFANSDCFRFEIVGFSPILSIGISLNGQIYKKLFYAIRSLLANMGISRGGDIILIPTLSGKASPSF